MFIFLFFSRKKGQPISGKDKVIRDYPDSYTKIEIFRLNLLSGEVHTLYGLNLGLVNKVLDKMHGIELGLINLPP
ncbi:LA_2272/LA_2273 family lipoprotein [Leptospira santarosai]|uniref:LA_2272/LA_2273 family lipoprotein n=1 Tax=Leptospira santarosai TaxID=28183 RepID=UPI003D15F4D3